MAARAAVPAGMQAAYQRLQEIYEANSYPSAYQLYKLQARQGVRLTRRGWGFVWVMGSRFTHYEFSTATSYHVCLPQLRQAFQELLQVLEVFRQVV